MPTYYEIPLVASPQKFTVVLGGINYAMRLSYHGAVITSGNIGGWVLDISDLNTNPIAAGIPLVTGIDLLYQYEYLGISGSLIVATDGDVTDVPTFENLGTDSHLYFVVFP